jgi:hypothetical protein
MIMDTKVNLLKQSNKKKSTFLDKAYNLHITNVLDSLNEEMERRWETYDLILEELKKETKKDYINEVKYRFSDGEDYNSVIIEILDRESESINDLLWYLKRRVDEYIEEDYFKNFF